MTIIDNLSRGNAGAVESLRANVPDVKGRLRFVEADLGRKEAVEHVFASSSPPVDLVIHFAAVAFVGESVAKPLMYYSNITSNTVILLGAMHRFGVKQLIYSSTCAVYGNPATLPITEETPTEPINPYGRAKLMAEQAVKDFAAANKESFHVAILRYFNVFGADPEGRLGELPRPELRSQGRISTACYDAALGLSPELAIYGTNFPTRDGTCIRALPPCAYALVVTDPPCSRRLHQCERSSGRAPGGDEPRGQPAGAVQRGDGEGGERA